MIKNLSKNSKDYLFFHLVSPILLNKCFQFDTTKIELSYKSPNPFIDKSLAHIILYSKKVELIDYFANQFYFKDVTTYKLRFSPNLDSTKTVLFN